MPVYKVLLQTYLPLKYFTGLKTEAYYNTKLLQLFLMTHSMEEASKLNH